MVQARLKDRCGSVKTLMKSKEILKIVKTLAELKRKDDTIKKELRPGMAVHTYKSSYEEAE